MTQARAQWQHAMRSWAGRSGGAGAAPRAHVAMLSASACGMPPASRFRMATARHLASSTGLPNSASSRGTSASLGRSALAPSGTSASSCPGASSQICAPRRAPRHPAAPGRPALRRPEHGDLILDVAQRPIQLPRRLVADLRRAARTPSPRRPQAPRAGPRSGAAGRDCTVAAGAAHLRPTRHLAGQTAAPAPCRPHAGGAARAAPCTARRARPPAHARRCSPGTAPAAPAAPARPRGRPRP